MQRSFTLQIEGVTQQVTIDQQGEAIIVTINDRVYNLSRAMVRANLATFSVDNRQMKAVVAKTAERWLVHIAGRAWTVTAPLPQSRQRPSHHSDGANAGQVAATMPGQVLKIAVQVGDPVERGQTLVLLEAMKMELRMSAPFEGVVTHIHCHQGQTVDRGQLLVEIKAEADN